MRTQDGFTLMDKSEVKDYLAKQKVTRKITIYKYLNLYNIRK